jgi:GNAT superfamily N-acetyltransferase
MSVRVVSPDQPGDLLTVLCDAFCDYPVMRYVLGDRPGYDRRLRTLVDLFTAARANPNGLMLGLDDPTGSLAGAALVDLPSKGPPTPAFEARRESAWEELGQDARARYEAYGRATREHNHPLQHHHLGMIGVLRSHHGTGLGRTLLVHVHALAEADSQSAGVSLTTEVARNVTLYEHFGYGVAAHVRVAPELESWVMFRPC